MVNAICVLLDMKKLLEILVDKTLARTNIHTIFTFDTAGTQDINKDIGQILGLPKGYSGDAMTVFSVGGGFTYLINGETPKITGVAGMTVANEDINNVTFTPAGIAGTAVIRFGAYIKKV